MKLIKLAWPAAAVLAIGAGSYVATLTHPFDSRVAQAQDQQPATNNAPAEGAPTPQVNQQTVAPLQELSQAFRQVHDSVEGAVVNINTEKRYNPRAVMGQIPDEFRQFFNLPPDEGAPARPGAPDNNGDNNDNNNNDNNNNGQPQGRLRPYATGSGVIVRPDGYIVTNNHVISGAEAIKVTLADSREFDAKVIGRDPKTDLAVIKIEAPHLTYARWGDSKNLQVGDWVLAFGSPFGFAQTMTQGIISAKGRTNLNIIAEHNAALQGLTYEDFLQTDAAINPGNSGGPLVDLQGHIVGINSAIASRSGAYNGIGFAIPSNEAKLVTTELIAHGKIVRGYLGIGIGPLTVPQIRQQAQSVGYTGTNGVFVSTVEANSPASQAGLQAGDVITELDGKKIDDFQTFRNQIADTHPGEKVTLTAVRNGKPQQITVTVGTQPESLASLAEPSQPGAPETIGQYGLKIANQDDHVVITAVAPQSPLAEQGVKAGDTILSVQGKKVSDSKQVQDALANQKHAKGLHMIVRAKDGTTRFIFLESQASAE